MDVRIADYGEAKITESTLKSKQSTRGTLDYMSPEMKNNGVWDKPTDIFSLGMTFYRLFTGKFPDYEKEIRNDQWIP